MNKLFYWDDNCVSGTLAKFILEIKLFKVVFLLKKFLLWPLYCVFLVPSSFWTTSSWDFYLPFLSLSSFEVLFEPFFNRFFNSFTFFVNAWEPSEAPPSKEKYQYWFYPNQPLYPLVDMSIPSWQVKMTRDLPLL